MIQSHTKDGSQLDEEESSDDPESTEATAALLTWAIQSASGKSAGVKD